MENLNLADPLEIEIYLLLAESARHQREHRERMKTLWLFATLVFLVGIVGACAVLNVGGCWMVP